MHRETCELHANDGTTKCSGTLKKGGTCTYKVTGPPVPHMMPTCKIHQDQQKVSGRCRAKLPCGFECDRLFEWKPYGFQLCPIHRECLMDCYFLKMPTELRLRVYQLLLPGTPIPAGYSNCRVLRSDGKRVYTEILRVNHQIHDEATSLLYGNSTFTIKLSNCHLSMCNMTKPFLRYGSPNHGSHLQQDYQMELLLLEQISQRRLTMARQLEYSMNGESSSIHPPTIQFFQMPKRAPVSDGYTPVGPIWNPQLSERYFDMIRSFIIELDLSLPTQRSSYGHLGSLIVDPTSSATEVRLYDYCDHLHRLVGRLRRIQRPLVRLEIIIKFGLTYIERDDVFSAAHLLLEPFRRLRNVAKPKVLSITMEDSLGREIELLVPDGVFSTADSAFVDYAKCWSTSLSSAGPSPEPPQVFEAYWQLEKLLSIIKSHFPYPNPNFASFRDLLHTARIAREAENLTRFREIWEQVVNIWFDYLNSQESFQSQVARSIHDIYDIVGN